MGAAGQLAERGQVAHIDTDTDHDRNMYPQSHMHTHTYGDMPTHTSSCSEFVCVEAGAYVVLLRSPPRCDLTVMLIDIPTVDGRKFASEH